MFLLLIFMMGHLAFAHNSSAREEEYRTLAPILSSAEKFFISLKAGDYNTVWDLLSEYSHNKIISDVYEVAIKINGDINREYIIKDFNNRGMMFMNYWNSFQRSFDADMILEHSEWEMGIISRDRAEIIITYNDAEGPTRLKMSKEQDSWKVGLAETFWQRKALNLLHFVFQ